MKKFKIWESDLVGDTINHPGEIGMVIDIYVDAEKRRSNRIIFARILWSTGVEHYDECDVEDVFRV